MNRLLPLLLLACAAPAEEYPPSPAPDKTAQTPVQIQAQRWVIITAENRILTEAPDAKTEKVVFLLDTRTGATWRYVETFDTKTRKYQAGWSPVGQYGQP